MKHDPVPIRLRLSKPIRLAPSEKTRWLAELRALPTPTLPTPNNPLLPLAQDTLAMDQPVELPSYATSLGRALRATASSAEELAAWIEREL